MWGHYVIESKLSGKVLDIELNNPFKENWKFKLKYTCGCEGLGLN